MSAERETAVNTETKKDLHGCIYCIEGVWQEGFEPTVEPILEQVRRLGQWDYRRRDCATKRELKWYIRNEWWSTWPRSMLYIATHGSEWSISLSKGVDIGLDKLGDIVGEGGGTQCIFHFSGCSVLSGKEDSLRRRLKEFFDKTDALAVSGYSQPAGWANALERAPALALELMLFSTLYKVSFDGRGLPKLCRVADSLKERFSDCGFDLYTREDPRLFDEDP